tara:strand:- start:5682 stop:6467 length:786 start_codon:yes stop_codon:yes gene_type:complete
LLKANYKPKNWKGIPVAIGQTITSRETLSRETGLSIQQIRTSLNKLKSTSDITIKSTSTYTVVTLAAYSLYQSMDELPTIKITSDSTNEQQTDNKPITTTKEVKNIRMKEDKNNASLLIFTDYGFSDQQIKLIFDNRTKNSKSAKSAKITEIIAKSICKEMKLCTDAGYTIDNVLNEWHETSWVAFKSEWIQKRIPLINNVGNYNGQDQFKRNTKQTPIQQAATDGERLRAAIAARREHESFLGVDDQAVRTQVVDPRGCL